MAAQSKQRTVHRSKPPAKPRVAEAEDLGKRGARLIGEGKFAEAEAAFHEALRAHPNKPELLHDLAVALARQGKLEEAILRFEESVRLNPTGIDGHGNLALAYIQNGKVAESIPHYEQVVQARPDSPDAHLNLANALRKAGRLAEAVTAYRKAVEIKPDSGDLHHSLGLALSESGKKAEAMACYREAIRLKADFAEAHNNLGVLLEEAGKLDEAIACFHESLRINPNAPETHSNHGVALAEQGKTEEAITAYERSLSLNPNSAQAHNNLANSLRGVGRVDEAVSHHLRAIEILPEYAEAYNNLGIDRVHEGDQVEALACYDRALSMKPEYFEARLNRSLAWLITGDLERGWAEYEWRWRVKPLAPRKFREPRWDGSPLNGRVILLYAEQGLGDSLQFIRYARLARERGGRVLFECPRPLLPLLGLCPFIDQLIPQGESLPSFDVQASLLSMPGILGTTLASVPAEVPYLSPRADLEAKWAQNLRRHPGLNVGIAWQGSAQYKGDRQRSIPLRYFAPLAQIPGITFLSVQKGAGTEQIASCGFTVYPLGEKVDEAAGAFMDTAAALKHLDLLITSDTAIPHLAGALGVPVWMALPFAPDWRWLLDREDSPWYPTMRLFRQRQRGDWKEVFARIAHALKNWAETKPARSIPIRDSANESPETIHQRGSAFFQAGKLTEAAECFRRATALRPDWPEAWHNLAVTLAHDNHLAEAVPHFLRALELEPNSADAHGNLGLAYLHQRKLERAAEHLQRALLLRPGAETYNNLGVTRLQQNRSADAVTAYRQALKLTPEYAEAHNNLGRALLAQENFAEGWGEYEWRWRCPNGNPRKFREPRWDGSPLRGRTLLLYAEQGLGDILQFIRFAQQVPREGGKVIAEVPSQLLPILRNCPGIDWLIPQGSTLPPFACQLPLLSLPLVFGPSRSCSEGVPYLSADPELVRIWKEKLRSCTGFKVGIAWQGNPKFTGDPERSIPLRHFAALNKIPGIKLFSLQKGAGLEQINAVGGGVTLFHLGKSFDEAAGAFMDTAAVMKSLDLVVTSDTSVAHLAGALGMRVWVLLPFASDWRWFLDRGDSPWYPTMRLFRQRVAGDWPELFARVVDALRQECGQPFLQNGQTEAVAPASDDYRQAIDFFNRGELGPAGDCLRRAAERSPESFDVIHALGVVQAREGRLEPAIASFRKAIQLQPQSGEAFGNLGLALHHLGRNTEAVKALRTANKLRPDAATDHNNLGVALHEMGRDEEAIASYRVALRLQPHYAAAHNNLAETLRKVGEIELAIAHCHEAIRLAPNLAEAHNTLGIAIWSQRHSDEAFVEYQEALRIRPDYAEAHLNRALAWLGRGDMERGWPEYEWRFRVKPLVPREFRQPRWDGSPLDGRAILIYAEQGLGDSLQFIRYARVARERGGRVLFECPRALVPLFGLCSFLDQVIPQGEPLPSFDVQAPLLSLPGILGTKALSDVPAEVPYLSPRADLDEKWGETLQQIPGFKVGIAWQGSAKYGGDRLRSVPLWQFAPLSRVPGVTLISLQKGPGTEQLAQSGFPVRSLGDALDEDTGAFMDSAAVMKHLDLVITSDTSIPHLAGALGVPVWLALPCSADWRWLLEREDSPWYPTMRLFRQKRRDDWEEVFGRIAQELAGRISPAKAQHHDQALKWMQVLDYSAAEREYRAWLQLDPSSWEAWHNLGVAIAQQGRYPDAIAAFQKCLSFKPDSLEALNNLGLAYLHAEKPEEAESTLRRSLKIRSDQPEAMNHLGVSLIRQKKNTEAAEVLERVIPLRPVSVDPLCNLGNALRQSNQYQAALERYDQALQIEPDCVQVHSNRGIALSHLGRHEDAITSYRRALKLDPGNSDAANNLGVLLADTNCLDEARACLDLALAAKSENPETHRNRAIVMLLQGDYENGWSEYQWRWRTRTAGRPEFAAPLWDGGSLAGRTILLHHEQGLGDTLQFVRYAPLVKQAGGTVMVRCQKPLVRLLSRCAGIDRLIADGDPLPKFDVQAPLMDLPAILHTTLETIPREVPYLFAEEERIEFWRKQLGFENEFKVGIAWQGSPTYGGDNNRSIPLKAFAPLAALKGVRLVSLQKGHGTQQIGTANVPLIDLERQLDNEDAFVDTVAVMRNLDMVITSDTSIPHLTGALGMPVWVALCIPCDWRFLRRRSDCPWYPTMRLFRQTRRGEWNDVFADIAGELRRAVAAKSAGKPIVVPIAPGELVDRLTLLAIKLERISDPAELRNVEREHAALTEMRAQSIPPTDEVLRLAKQLRSVNETLWEMEDQLRDCGNRRDFGPRFIELARAVHQNKDQRAALKRQINDLLDSRQAISS